MASLWCWPDTWLAQEKSLIWPSILPLTVQRGIILPILLVL